MCIRGLQRDFFSSISNPDLCKENLRSRAHIKAHLEPLCEAASPLLLEVYGPVQHPEAPAPKLPSLRKRETNYVLIRYLNKKAPKNKTKIASQYTFTQRRCTAVVMATSRSPPPPHLHFFFIL